MSCRRRGAPVLGAGSAGSTRLLTVDVSCECGPALSCQEPREMQMINLTDEALTLSMTAEVAAPHERVNMPRLVANLCCATRRP